MKSLIFRHLYELVTILALTAMFVQFEAGAAIAQTDQATGHATVEDLAPNAGLDIVFNK